MSTTTENGSAADAGATAVAGPGDSMTEFWTRYFEQSDLQARAMLEALRSAADPLTANRRWTEAVSESLEGFLRSPEFLEAMRRNTAMAIEIKKAQNGIVQSIANELGVPTAADVAGLFERINGAERAVQASLDRIEARLGTIEARLARAPEPAGQAAG